MKITQEQLRYAFGELGAALSQSRPSDDQIIMEHVRNAHGVLQRALLAEDETPLRMTPSEIYAAVVAEPFKTIIASLEGAKFDIYRTHVHRFVMDFSNGPGGRWRYKDTYTIPSYGVCDSNLTDGINEADRQEILTAIAEVQRG